MKLSEFANNNSISYQAAYNMFKRGLIKGRQLPTGTIVITEDVDNKKPKSEYTVIYTRVSSSKNVANLEAQAERLVNYCIAKGYIVDEVVKECGSGLNDKRPKLQKILKEGKVTRLVVEHTDRLTRFGFNYISLLCEYLDCEVIIVNPAQTEKEDLMQDFISIITSFCARIYGQRRCRRKTESIIKELQSND